MARKALSKKIRFEVFKRDSFTCQYCGRSAPDVILQVDHIKPVASGGNNNILNLVTSCHDCNIGKGAKELSDQTVLKAQIDQAKIISEKREQLKMLAEWQASLANMSEHEIKIFEDRINSYGVGLSEYGRECFKKIIKQYGLAETLCATEKSYVQYLNDPSKEEDRAKFLDMIRPICYWQKRERDNPGEAELRKIAYTANHRWWKCNPRELIDRLGCLHRIDGVSIDVLRDIALSVSGIMAFEKELEAYFSSKDI